MKTSIKLVLVYALLLVLLSLTLSSCFLFQKHKTITKSSTDSTAYQRTESTILKHQEEAWNNYLINLDSSSSKVYFYDNGEPKWVKIDTNGTIEAKGAIKEFVHKAGKQTIKKDSGYRILEQMNIHTNTQINRTITRKETKIVERKPDYKAIATYGAVVSIVLALIGFVVWKWAKIKLWVIDKAKGLFTNFFH